MADPTGRTNVDVKVERLAQEEWPRSELRGLDEAVDGPWPRSVKLNCSWPGGAVELSMNADFWRMKKESRRHLCALSVEILSTRRKLVWCTLARKLGQASDGDVVSFDASVAMYKRKNYPNIAGWGRVLREQVASSGLPMRTKSNVELFKADVPSCRIEPAPEVAFRRIVRVALLKLDFLDPEHTKERGMLVDAAKLVKSSIESGEEEAEEEAEEEGELAPSERKYWAGGFLWGDQSQLKAFKEGDYWQLGWGRDATQQAAKTSWRRFDEIQEGDWFAIKGYGGSHDLVVHYVGEVRAIDPDRGRVELATDLFHGKAPRGPGAGKWFDALLPVRQPRAIATIFGVRSEAGPSDRLPEYPDLNLILYGPPGTGKTFRLQRDFFPKFTPRAATDSGTREDYTFVTFHQSYTYEDFVEGIRPNVDQIDGDAGVRYILEDGVFKRAVRSALRIAGFEGSIDAFCALSPDERQEQLEGAPHYALFVDEINRGNVANIFGELITLLEEDKRLGCDNELIVTLPYSKTRFGVPSNLHLIGTMNTADRSVESLDAALRRRFAFHECAPRYDVLDFEISGGVDPAKMLRAINERIDKLYDRDHMIGHAYLIPIEQDPSLERLKECFGRRIIPLLQEYFFSDWGQIALILGREFVRRVDREVRFADADHDDLEALRDRPSYELADLDDITSVSFRRIYEHVSDDN